MKGQQSIPQKNTAAACRLLRQLSGLTISAYARKINISHTYWKELESGIKCNPSDKIKTDIAKLSGLSFEAVDYLLQESHPGSQQIYDFLISSLEEYIKNLRMNLIVD